VGGGDFVIIGGMKSNHINMQGFSVQQKEQLEYLSKVSSEKFRQEDEWLSWVLRCVTTLLSISAPLSLAVDIPESPRFFLLAALLSALLSMVTGSARLHATVRMSRYNLEAVSEDTKNFRFLVPVSTPLSRLEKVCATMSEIGFLLALVFLLLAILFALFSFEFYPIEAIKSFMV